MGCAASKPAVVHDGDVLVGPSEGSGKSSTTRARRLSVSAEPKAGTSRSATPTGGDPAARRPGGTPDGQQPQQQQQRGGSPDRPAGSRSPVPRSNGSPTPGAEPRAARAPGGLGKAPKGAAPAAAPDLPTNAGQILERNSSTRARRLSYVTNDKDLADKIRAEYGDGLLEGLAAADGAAFEPPPPGRRAVSVAVACMSRAGREPGYKKTNQDNCFAFEKYISEDESLFGAMDGHGPQGHLVSSFVKQHLPILLVDHLTNGSPPAAALARGFLEVDARLGASRIDTEFSGSTCVVAHLRGNQLTTAWVGDSRGVLGRRCPESGVWQALDLTYDHKPTAPGEKERILRSQGRVARLMDELGQPMGPYRVWLQYAWVPGLAMSRALGDQLAHQVGVSSEPDHHAMDLGPSDRFMVLASDGVWEFMSSQEVVDLVAAWPNVEDACRALVDEAYQRWLIEEDGVVDDITAVVVRFCHGDGAGGGGIAVATAAAEVLGGGPNPEPREVRAG